MCGPYAAIASFAMQAAGQLTSAVMGGQADKAAYDKKLQAINAEADSLDKSVMFKYQLTQLQKQQIQDRVAAETGENRLKLAEAQDTALAAAATGGVEGPSVAAMMKAFGVATGKDIMWANQQGENEVNQVRNEERATFNDAENRKIALRNQVPDDPTSKIVGRYLAAAIGVGDAYMKSTTKSNDGSGFLGRKFG